MRNCIENKKVTRVRAGEFLMTLALVIPCIIGCSGHFGTSKNEAILTAENLIWTRPDSTIAILEGLDTVFLTENDKMMWFLLHEQAGMRYTRKPVNDSILDYVLDYFDKQDMRCQVCQTLYVKGASRFLQKDYVEAILYLKEAEQLIPYLDAQQPYAGQIYLILGYASETEQLTKVANTYFKSALPYLSSGNDDYRLACCYRDIARTADDSAEANQNFLMALDIATNLKDSILLWDIKIQQLSHNNSDSTENLRIHKRMTDSLKIARTAAYVAKYYLEKGQDSIALQYLTIFAKDTNNLYWSQDNYHYLHSLYLMRIGLYDDGYDELKQVYDNLCQQILTDAKVRTYAIARRYDLEREQQKTLRLTIARQRLWMTIGAVVLILLVVTAAAAWVIQRQHRVSERLAQEKALARAQQERAEAQAQAAQERQKAQAAKMKILKRKAREQKKLLCQSLHDRIQLIGNLKKKLEQHPQASPDWLGIFIDSNLLDSPKGWTAFSNEFKKIYGKKPEMLRKEYPRLTDEDIRYLSLSLIGLDTEDIGNLLHLQSRTLWNRKQKVKSRLNGVDDLDAWSEKWQEDNYILSPDEDDD